MLLRQVPAGLQILGPGRDETIPQPLDWVAGYPRAVREALEAYGRGDPPPIPTSECAHAVRLVFDAYRTAGELYRFMVDQFNQSRAFFLESAVVIILVIELIYFFRGKPF